MRGLFLQIGQAAGILCILGCSRTVLVVVSPNQLMIASVRSSFSIDPPNDSLWLQRVGSPSRRLLDLAEDQDWCHTIVWSKDSSTVAYLVQDGRLVIVDAASGQIVGEPWLVKHEGYPPAQVVRELALSPDGSAAVFRRCERKTDLCGERVTFLLRHDAAVAPE